MKDEETVLETWQRRTDRVSADVFDRYFLDGNTRRLAALRRLEDAFDRVLREVRGTKVGDVPAVWALYNMGVVVKTREALFAIDLHHRRAAELAPLLDFALITHNHPDHWRPDFYNAMNSAGKTVVSNFLDNYGVQDWRRDGGYSPGERTFRIRDVEIHTTRIDHNDYLVDFTTAFEVRVGKWTLYHTGDSGRGTEAKLGTIWGRPDLWLFFPGCGIDVAEAVRRVQPKRLVFGHLWELGHKSGRLDAPLIRKALAAARSVGVDPTLAFWGTRII
jgi:L-ascorbate metabolism protein UlaG (beta-lactamase superfamily)